MRIKSKRTMHFCVSWLMNANELWFRGTFWTNEIKTDRDNYNATYTARRSNIIGVDNRRIVQIYSLWRETCKKQNGFLRRTWRFYTDYPPKNQNVNVNFHTTISLLHSNDWINNSGLGTVRYLYTNKLTPHTGLDVMFEKKNHMIHDTCVI